MDGANNQLNRSQEISELSFEELPVEDDHPLKLMDILASVFFYLDYQSMVSVSLVNRQWQKVALDKTGCMIMEFVSGCNTLFCNLNPQKSLEPSQHNISLILLDNPLENCLTIQALGKYIVNALQNYSFDNLDALEKAFPKTVLFEFFKNTFTISIIFQKSIPIEPFIQRRVLDISRNRMARPIERASDYTTRIINDLLCSEMIDDAIEIAIRMPDGESKRSALESIVKALMKTSKGEFIETLDKALRVAYKISDKKRQSSSLEYITTFLTNGCSGKDYFEANMDEALVIARTIPDKKIQSNLLCTIVKALINEDSEYYIDIALMITEEIVDKNSQNDALLTITFFLKKLVDLEDFIQIVERVIKIAKTIGSEEESAYYIFDNISDGLIAISKNFMAAGKSKLAIEAADLIPRKYKKKSIFRELFESLIKKNLSEAEEIAAIIQEWDIKVSTFHRIAQAHLKEGVAKAKVFADTIADQDIKAYVLCDICMALLNKGNIQELKAVANTIPKDLMESTAEAISHSLREICQSLVKKKMIDSAKEIVNIIPDIDVRDLALSDISMALLKGKKHDEAIKIAEAIVDPEVRSTVLLTICDALIEQGQIDWAIKLSDTIPEEGTKSTVIQSICEALIDENKIDAALVQAERLLDEDKKAWVLRDICTTLGENGEYNQAIDLAKTIAIDSIKQSAMERICTKLVSQGEIDWAIELVHTMANGFPKQAVLKFICLSLMSKKILDFDKILSVGHSLIKITNEVEEDRKIKKNFFYEFTNKLEDLLRKHWNINEHHRPMITKNIQVAIKLAELIPIQERKEILLRKISEGLKNWADNTELEDALEIAGLIPHEYYKATALQSISMDYLKANNIDKALEIAAMIMQPHVQKVTLATIYLRTEQFDKAVEIAKEISNIESKISILKDVCRALINKHNYSKARQVAKEIPDDEDETKKRMLKKISESEFYSGW